MFKLCHAGNDLFVLSRVQDLSPMFKKLKRYCKNTGFSLRPAFHLRNAIVQEFTKNQQLVLTSLKKTVRCDLVGAAPLMFGTCVTSADIQHGFVKSGLLRKTMFRTCVRTRGKNGAKILAQMRTATQLCYPIMLAQGGITDNQLHHKGGLPYDTDKNGNQVIQKYVDAECEPRQRAKC